MIKCKHLFLLHLLKLQLCEINREIRFRFVPAVCKFNSAYLYSLSFYCRKDFLYFWRRLFARQFVCGRIILY